jgi:hypothetical protein
VAKARSISKTIPISTRAVVQRVNRLLKAEGKELRRTRGVFAERDFGDYHIICDGTVISDHIDLEEFARKNGALEPYEHLQMNE